MCYHYSLTKTQKEILRRIQAEWETPFEPIYHIGGFDFPVMPVVAMNQKEKVQAYTWGLIPHWSKNLADAQKIRAQALNAKAETIFEKPSFRTYIQNNRCLVLADGFFEWMEFQKKKYPHFVHLKDNELFAFAGIYSHWADKETGELFKTFAIITTEANPLMARIHHVKKRMPVILTKEQWNTWLDPSLVKEQIAGILKPCADENMTAYPISRLITARKGADTNVPEVQEIFNYPELAFAE
jgi:putative SOS response-associated peptidase YedK